MKRHLLSLILISTVLFSIFLSILPAHAQIVENTRLAVEEHLRQVLGREFSVIEYNFESATYPDSALGCPKTGETYTPGEIAGYRWAFLLDDSIRYEVHSDLSGSQVVLCLEQSTPEISYSWYNGTAFTIKYPGNWNPTIVSETEVSFTFRGQVACNVPGMRVLLFTDFLKATEALPKDNLQNAVEMPLGEYLVSEAQGTTITYLQPCEDRMQKWRATAMNTASGAGYMILQWSPEVNATIWEIVFRDMLNSFVSNLTAAPTPNPADVFAELPTVAADPNVDLTTVPLVHVFVGDIWVGRINNLPGRTLTYDGTVRRDQLELAPVTHHLAYVENDTKLYMVDNLDGGSNLLIAETMAMFPPVWSPDGTRLVYVVTTDTEGKFAVKSRLTDGTEQELGEITLDTGVCDAVPAYDVEKLYWRETGFNGNEIQFEWLPGARFLISTNCNGIGLAIWTPVENTLTPVGEDLYRAQLSPDGTKLAALSANGLVIVDLATLEATPVTTEFPPDQLAWDNTGTQLFYSTIIPLEPVIWDDPATQANAEAVLGVFPFESRLNTLRIYQLNLATGEQAQRWEQEGFAVGSLEIAPGSTGLLFTLIPSDRGFLASFSNNDPVTKIVNSIPETQLYWLPLQPPSDTSPVPSETGGATLLAITAQASFGR